VNRLNVGRLKKGIPLKEGVSCSKNRRTLFLWKCEGIQRGTLGSREVKPKKENLKNSRSNMLASEISWPSEGQPKPGATANFFERFKQAFGSPEKTEQALEKAICSKI